MENQAIQQSPKRPIGVWIIFVYTLVSLAFIATGIYILFASHLSATVPAGPVDYLLSGIIAILNLAGAIYLFMLRKRAIWLLIVALIINVLSTLFFEFRTHWSDNPISLLGGYTIAVAIIAYAYWLQRKGVLK